MDLEQLFELTNDKTKNTIATVVGLTLNEVSQVLERHELPEVAKLIEIYFRSKYSESILKGM